MQNPLKFFNRNSADFLRYILLFMSVVIVLMIIPKKGKFKYEYEQGKPWMHDDLSAPFTFAILKTNKEIKAEQNEIRENFKPFYNRDTRIENTQKDKLINDLTTAMNQEGDISADLKKFYLSKGISILTEIYDKGIINIDTLHSGKAKDFLLFEEKNAKASEKPIGDYYTLREARSLVIERTEKDSILNQGWFLKSLLSDLTINVSYDKRLSEKKLDELLGSISTTRGIVKQDEKIISKGSLVSPERYRMLESLRNEYETNIGKSYTIPLGYLVLITSLFLMYGIYLHLFQKTEAASLRNTILVLINMLIFVGITSYFVISGKYSIYTIPYCIIPIVLVAFFGVRMAIVSHLLVIFVCGLIVPNPFEFLLLQVVAGFAAVLTLSRLKYISQFFISSLLIFFAYAVIYLGISFIKTSTFKELEWQGLQWFGINFILTLLAYPLVYAYEKVFGIISDIRLLELADIHNKLLKELMMRAPGTFQHSLQVSNLAEAVTDRLGGNSLLARVGGLYHDIGKLYNPDFFTENQKGGIDPHQNLPELESAGIIIAHVTQGVELAQKNSIPNEVIDFIRSHHGTTRVEYFYRHYIQDHELIDDSAFRYPGPKPSSKEMAVVMIVDSVEASLRSIQNPDDKQLENLIDKMIDMKIQDNQFDNANITIQEINTVRRVLKKLMKSIYHVRVQYPAAPVINKN